MLYNSNHIWVNYTNSFFNSLFTGEPDPADDFILNYKFDGSDSSLVRFNGDDYRIAPSCPEATGSWFQTSLLQYYTANADSAIWAQIADGPFSISFWVNSNIGDTVQGLFASGGGANTISLRTRINGSGKALIRVNSIATNSEAFIADGNWHHVVFTCAGTGSGAIIYIDGSFDKEGNAINYNLEDTGQFEIGRTAGGGDYLNGGVDDYRMYDRVLSDNEIQQLSNYRCDLTPNAFYGENALWLDASDITSVTESAGLVSQWDDKSGNNYDATQSVDNDKPQYLLKQINGINAISHRSTLATYMSMPDEPTVIQCLAVGVNTDGNSGSLLVYGGQSGFVAEFSTRISQPQIAFNGVETKYNIYGGTFSEFSTTHVEPDITSGNPFLLGGVFQSTVTLNNVVGRPALTIPTDGEFVGEILWFSSELSDKNRKELEGYLAWKWFKTTDLVSGNPALPSGHPYKLKPPISKTSIPRPIMDYDFAITEDIIEGATNVDVAGWVDRGTSSSDLSQAVATQQPLYDLNSKITFDGDDYLEGMTTLSGDFTYFFKINTTTRNTALIGSSLFGSHFLYIGFDGTLFYTSSFGSLDAITSTAIDSGDDIVIAVVRKGDVITGYVDGSEELSKTDAGDFLVDVLAKRTGQSDEYIGDMFNVQVYDQALSARQIKKISDDLAQGVFIQLQDDEGNNLADGDGNLLGYYL